MREGKDSRSKFGRVSSWNRSDRTLLEVEVQRKGLLASIVESSFIPCFCVNRLVTCFWDFFFLVGFTHFFFVVKSDHYNHEDTGSAYPIFGTDTTHCLLLVGLHFVF